MSDQRDDPRRGAVPPPTTLDPEAFAARFEQAYRRLWLIAAGVLNDPAAAEDVVQEAAIVALRKLPRFDPTTDFVAWTGQIVRFLALNRLRQRRRDRTSSAAPDVLAQAVATAAPPSRETPLRIGVGGTFPDQQEHFDDAVVAALAQLNETARLCLLFRTLEGLEYGEISRLLGIPEGTAMSHVHRARGFLREQLLSQDTGYAGGAAS